MSIDTQHTIPTITIRPEPKPKADAAAIESARGFDNQKQTVEYAGSGGFGDFLDFINPLQHIPVVGSIYRAITGDEISTGSKLAGGALFGGVVGFLAAAASEIFEEGTGKSVETHVAELISDDATPSATAQTASATSAAAVVASSAATHPSAVAMAEASQTLAPTQVARQAPVFKPQQKEAKALAPALEPLDLSDTTAPVPAAPVATPATVEEQNKQEMILDLFSQREISNVSDAYKQAQMRAYTAEVASKLKA